MAGEDQAAAAALKGWKVYFNTVTITGRRNVGNLQGDFGLITNLQNRKIGLNTQKVCTLVPRLPHSGTKTLKLCRWGEPGIFCHVSSVKGRKGVEKPSM